LLTNQTVGALDAQKGSGGSSTIDFGTAGHALLSGGGACALDTWDSGGVTCSGSPTLSFASVKGTVTHCWAMMNRRAALILALSRLAPRRFLIDKSAHPRQQLSELVLEGQEIQHGRQRRRYEHPIMHGGGHSLQIRPSAESCAQSPRTSLQVLLIVF
jgi:hypothetical protein